MVVETCGGPSLVREDREGAIPGVPVVPDLGHCWVAKLLFDKY